ncbi:polysaccharide biosynthesis protein CapD [Oceaniovalibus guishaninsula JLT2003]|uniref:Polysaccharide biosynthesis protein CapD n=1 Tax=Oceaniovalibus guishaninsula JLT2003 TaxID=1231392 RepID=K2HBK8_9RHOB|nr:nucleoside-diphosphate sugar epimerase/dehydratase [Oceaniovalibus guishaninsula]EKE44002.1 polysaccharide biosynthesis protein CapD [Oceaniovalibus guishaninsula JLT2003]
MSPDDDKRLFAGLRRRAGRVQDALFFRILRLNRDAKRAFFLLTDTVTMLAAYAFTLAVQGLGVGRLGEPGKEWLILALMVLMTAVISVYLKIPNIRLVSFDSRGFGRIGLMAALVVATGVALHFLGGVALGMGTFIVFGLMFFVFAAGGRVAMLEALTHLYRRQRPRCRVLIYGAGATGMQLARALSNHESIDPVAFVDDSVTLQGLTVAGLPVLRPVDIAKIAQERKVDRVLLAMPSLSHPKQLQLSRRIVKAGLEVQALPSFAQLIGEEALIEKFVPVRTASLLGRKPVNRRRHQGREMLEGKSVLVSGGGGSIGSELCSQVLDCRPKRLVIFELSELALYEVERALSQRAADMGATLVPVLGSVTEARLVRRVLAEHDVDVVLHAAAYKHVPMVERNSLVGLANNVLGTWTLAREAASAGVERFILISSDKAVRPTNIMGASKRLAEQVVQDLAARSQKTVFAMVRFGNVIGSSGSVIPLFQELIERGGPVTVTHRDVTRYFMTTEEAVGLVLVAGSFAKGGEVFVLDMGKPVRIWDIAHQMITDANYTVRDEANPDGDIEVIETGLRPGEKLHEELIIGEGHLTTAHEKIFCAHEAHLSEIEVATAIRSLREALSSGDEAAALRVACRWVEGYADAHEQATLALGV